MTKIIFGKHKLPTYNQGLFNGVVYGSKFQDGYSVWPGLVSIETTSEETQTVTVYVDGDTNRLLLRGGTYSATITSYVYPPEILDGIFNFTYSVKTRNPESREIHLIYGATASMGSIQHYTLSGDASVEHFQTDIITKDTPSIRKMAPVSHYVIRTDGLWKEAIEAIDNVLYGTDITNPNLPPIHDIIEILESYVYLKITDNLDGTWTAEEMNGAVNIIEMVSETEFSIDWLSALYLDTGTYTIESR